MATLIKNSYDVLILLSSKIIHDFKIKEDDWCKVIEIVKANVKSNVVNYNIAHKKIKDYLQLVEGDFYKKYTNEFNTELDYRKCYFKLVDWILQISQKQTRLIRAKHKANVAKNIIVEEMLEANKHMVHEAELRKIKLEIIIDRSIKTYLK